MEFPLRNSAEYSDPSGDHLSPSGTPNHTHAAEPRPYEDASEDLKRLECSLQWLQRERDTLGLEAALRAQKQRRVLPPAGQLAPVSGIPPVKTGVSCHTRKTLAFQVAQPLASERLQFPPPTRLRAYNLRGALCILIVILSVIAGSIAYQVSAGGLFSAAEPAQAALLQAR